MRTLLLLFLLFLLFTFTARAADFVNEFGSSSDVFESTVISGTAGDSYPAIGNAAVWSDTKRMIQKTVLIENTDTIDSCTYKIQFKVTASGAWKDYPGEVDIVIPPTDGSDYAVVNIPDHASAIAVFVKNASAGNNCNYAVSAGGLKK